MHNIDRTVSEYESPFASFEAEAFEFAGEGEGEGESERGGRMDDEYELMELAAELLEVNSEAELDRFLGGLFSRVARGVSNFARSGVGRALGGVLKKAAGAALPIVGGAIGSFVGGPAGTALGSKLGSMAGKAFGLELEGLSQEDREFEVAKQFVRLASDATARAAAAPQQGDPRAIARAAFNAAAQTYAPGLVTPPPGRPGAPGAGAAAGHGGGHRLARSGKWIRKGGEIILLGVKV
jgi:hypothetical protein